MQMDNVSKSRATICSTPVREYGLFTEEYGHFALGLLQQLHCRCPEALLKGVRVQPHRDPKMQEEAPIGAG